MPVIADEQSHHDLPAARLDPRGVWPRLINPIVAVSKETLICWECGFRNAKRPPWIFRQYEIPDPVLTP